MNRNYSFWLFFAFFMVSFLFGCMSQPGDTKLKVTMYSDAGAPKPPKTPIDIYSISHPPERSYEKIAKIEANDTDDDDRNFIQAINKALELGADAVVIIGRVGKDYGWVVQAIRYQ
jgi:hypothetical protein